ncbi:porin family protein [Fulvivirga sp. M361]|uniref:porin family protein n=1 Tax=Fulvivirga sp. M361 TaxID=2594266 RepID=UPI00162539B2|nr:porin family protein [Fulvivirga sp. M361]
MRKYMLLTGMLLFLAGGSLAQFKIGLQMTPILSTNRITADSDTLNIETNGTGLRFAFGPIIDVQIKENYYFSSGLLFVSKRAGIEASRPGDAGTPIRETYKLQYLRVPLALKLFTNEISIDKKIYFKLGTTMEFNIEEEAKDKANFLVDNFKFFDSSLLAGIGLEYRLGVNTTIFGGFTYNRGLLNVVSDQAPLDTDLTLKNDYVGIDLGVKF